MYKKIINDTITYINKLNNNYIQNVANNIFNIPLYEMVDSSNVTNIYNTLETTNFQYCLDKKTKIPGFNFLQYYSCSFLAKESIEIIRILQVDVVNELYFMFIVLIFLYFYTAISSIFGLRSVLLNYRDEKDEEDNILHKKEN